MMMMFDDDDDMDDDDDDDDNRRGHTMGAGVHLDISTRVNGFIIIIIVIHNFVHMHKLCRYYYIYYTRA